jgi:hypothetical protein
MERALRRLVPLVLMLGLSACSGENGPPSKHDGQATSDFFYFSDLYGQADLYPYSGDLPQNCSSSTCAGCCSGKICMEGITSSACGSSGGTCATCSSSQTCTSGSCVSSSCTASSCSSGCCDSSGCENGTSTSACGKAGGTCQACKSGESCVSGSCTTSSGKKLYKVTLVSGTVYAGGITLCMAGIGGALDYWCDPFAWLIVGKVQAKSSTESNNNSPAWNEELLTISDTELMAGIKVDLYDTDVAIDTPLGSATYTVTSSDLSKGTLTLDIKAVGVTTAQVILSFTAA